MIVYFDTKTGNVKRFIDKLIAYNPAVRAVNINDVELVTERGHLITYTTGMGNVPITTSYFMERYNSLILTVSASGNRNWGLNFAKSANILSEQYNIVLAHKFELSGIGCDVEIISKIITNT